MLCSIFVAIYYVFGCTSLFCEARCKFGQITACWWTIWEQALRTQREPERSWVAAKHNIHWNGEIFCQVSAYTCTVLMANSMELKPSWEANSCSATQEIPSILWNRKYLYHVHNSQPLILIVSQINPLHALPYYSYFFKIHFHIIVPSTPWST
jgi:hypothetical protein